MSENKDILWRAYLIYFGFVLIMLVVLFKTVSIQWEGRTNVFSSSEEKMPVRTVKRIPRRGEVLDVHYTPLVTSVSFYDIHMDPTVVDKKIFDEEITDLSKGLSKMFPEKTAREYENFIRTGRQRGSRYLLIKNKATNEERKQLRALPIFKHGRLKGGLIDTEETVVRKRPHGEMLKRTLGYYQKEGGKELRVGIEGAYNEFLSGEEGEEIEQKITTGWKKTGQIVKEAVEGADVVTTIDKEIQEVAHSELERQLRNQGAKSGCVVVMDVKTGYVRAIANLSQDTDGNYYELYNHAIGTKEVPGSTFKLASLMAALEDEKIDINDIVNSTGAYTFSGKTLHDALKGGYGQITIKRAFEKSSNVIAVVIHRAYRQEPQAFIDRLASFGLTEKLGIDLSGEPTPTIYTPGSRNWSRISLPWMAIGYEVQQTPLQTLAFYNAVANNGTLVRPQFVQEIRRGAETVKTYQPIILKDKICSDKTLKTLKECLKGVMKDGGTGSKLTSSLFDIAGKTGTARILNSNFSYGQKGEEKYQASFVGYFPADEPIYSCIVVVSAPSKDIYGATVSGTVFTAIANKVYASTLRYHTAINEGKRKANNIPSVMYGNRYDLLKVINKLKIPYAIQDEGEWFSTSKTNERVVLNNKSISKKSVPNLVGLSAKDAVYIVESLGMNAFVIGYGKVTKQSMPAGTPLFNGGVIELTME
ncbi:MAG: transpeptidase family protein [Crocinitomicaceae bacterium]|nr:transpeptidase family protein [Crocinitomicaceae bacterium]